MKFQMQKSFVSGWLLLLVQGRVPFVESHRQVPELDVNLQVLVSIKCLYSCNNPLSAC